MRIKLTFTLLLVFLLSLSSVEAGTISKPPYLLTLNSGLVGHWTFDGANVVNGVIRDISGQGNHGNVSGIATSTFYTVGKIGQGGQFDGVDDHIKTNNTFSTVGVSSTKTVSAWVKPTSGTSGFIFGIPRTFGSTVGFGIGGLSSGKWVGRYWTTTSAAVNSTDDALIGQWSLVTLVQSGANITLYVNGVSAATATNGGAFESSSRVAYIGAQNDNDTATNLFTGQIDDVRLYDRALSASEITKLYNFGSVKQNVSVAPAGLKSGLVGHWTFDGANITNGRINDISGQGNHGNTVNIATSTFYTAGKIGQALQFDGVDDYVTVSDNTTLRPGTSAWSMSAWIKPTNVNQFAGLVSKRDGGTFNQIALVAGDFGGSCSPNASKKIGFVVFDGTNGGCVETVSEIIDGNWHHITAVKNSNTGLDISVYVDGVSVSLSTVTTFGTGSSDVNNTVPWIIGCQNASANCVNGIVDDVRIYSRSLTATEVLELYNSGAPKKNITVAPTGLKSGLVGHWTFDGKNMTSGVAQDISGQGNNGNLTNISTSTFYTAGKIGQALQFDGVDDYLTIASTPAPGTEMTVSAWVYKKNNGYIIYRGSSSCCLSYRLRFSSSKVLFGIVTTSGSTPDIEITSNASVPDNTWTLITATYSSSASTLSIYINGVFDQSGTRSGTIITSENTTNIGAVNPAASYFSGNIDDVRIYNRALSASEILQLYNSGR